MMFDSSYTTPVKRTSNTNMANIPSTNLSTINEDSKKGDEIICSVCSDEVLCEETKCSNRHDIHINCSVDLINKNAHGSLCPTCRVKYNDMKEFKDLYMPPAEKK